MKTYYLIASSLFLMVSIIHIGIATLGLELSVGEYVVPPTMSVIASALTAYLAIRGYSALGHMNGSKKDNKKKNK